MGLFSEINAANAEKRVREKGETQLMRSESGFHFSKDDSRDEERKKLEQLIDELANEAGSW